MDVYEIAGYKTGVDREGVNYLQPGDAFQKIENGFIYRQVLQSRQGIGYFSERLADHSRVFGIFEHVLPDGEKQTLAFDRNFLYLYNTITGNFDQMPFGGSMGPVGSNYAGFNISSNEFYISGTSYPTASNTARFVFTGQGITANAAGSSIFFFNGTDVRDFTDLADNPNYAPPLDPITGAAGVLTTADFVVWFGERLNFLAPTITAVKYSQGMLFSGIRTGSGNGDKFNVAGAGLLQCDTYEFITGFGILGQILGLCFERSNWVIEKTKDAFNPYFSRKIPSVLGTTAKFSPVSWNNILKSVGRTGIISQDGRQSLRTDTKIPYFTQDDIHQPKFELTYGGFDRQNSQFLWTYLDSGSESDTQTNVLVNNYEEDTWSTYNLRLTVFGQTDQGLNLTWDQIDETSGNESWAAWDTTEEIWDKIGLGESVQKTLAGDDLGFIYQLNQDFDDYYADISAITQASQAVLTISESAFQAGDLVTISGVQGMTEINNFDVATQTQIDNPYVVVAATDTSITLNVDSTLFSPYTPNTGSITKIIEFKAETIPFNPYREQGRRCYIGYVEFLLDTNGGNLLVDVTEDEDSSPFIDGTLVKPSSTTKAREWVTMTVNNEANFMTFTLRQQSPSVQVKLTSMRIHCSPGGLTSG